MFLSYWGLKEKPFENTPDPRFMYYSVKHKEALLNLLYAVNENKGAALLTGDVGCGKTLIARTLITRLDMHDHEVAFITNPRFGEDDFVKEILFQFGLESITGSKIDLLHSFNDLLFNNSKNGKNNVLIIDEAQLIINKLILEEIRLLLNLQMDDRFLITIILIGQPELKATVKSMPQLDQRIGIRYHIEHLSPDDTYNFISYRLRVAGREKPIFGDDTIQLIYDYSKGIPRKINNICDICLVMGVARNLEYIDKRVVQELTSAERNY